MKILHISTSDNSGAGLCCSRIHKSMLEQGIDSKMVVLLKTHDEIPEVYQYGSARDAAYRYLSKILRVLGLTITLRNKLIRMSQIYHTTYTTPFSYVDLTKCDLLEQADIIHLHWVNWYLDYPSFFAKVQKPIVWTVHDENLFYGMAHHHKSILLDNKYEIYFREIKKKAIENAKNLNIVFLSQMMYENFGKESIIRGKRKIIINNSVDGRVFFPTNKETMRKKYGIDSKNRVILFMANDICDPNKGLDVLTQAVVELEGTNVQILAVGKNTQGKSWPNIMEVGSINDVHLLCEYLSVADFYALPSYQEAFSQGPLEAMACGLPVVAFPVSGTTELINDDNGEICADFTLDALKDGINTLLSRKYDSNLIREDVLKRFSPESITKQYIDYYKSILRK